MQNKRAAIFIPTFASGGAESTMVILARELQARGYEVDLLVKSKAGGLSQSIPDSLRIIEFNVSTMRYTLRKLISYCNKEVPVAIVSAMELPNLISVIAGLFARQRPKTIVSIHSILSKQKPIYGRMIDRILFGILYRLSDKIVCVSNTCAQDAIRYLGLPRAKVRVIYNPVFRPEILEKAKERISYAWLDDKPAIKILSIGRLVTEKDQKTLIKALKLVRERYDAQLIILGEGPLRSELLQLAQSLGLEQDVSLPGFVQNPYPLISQADVFVLSSTLEGLGNVLIEALACNCPVVSTDCPGGPREILDGGQYGHLTPVGDHAAMAEAILSVLSGDKRLAPPEWLEKFCLESSVDQYQQLIEGKDR
jgi:glycosyltransferase involved in cell wall biosynthesis